MEGAGLRKNVPELTNNHFLAADGSQLPLHIWEAKEKPKAVLLGVHGFNDYGNFLMPGMPSFLQENGVTLITYDQRGFGAGPNRGKWPGTDTLTNDLAMMVHLVKAQYENLPLFILGESMGGAVVINTLSRIKPLPVEGAILCAPAVWGMSTWPWYQKAALYAVSYTLPWLKLSGGGIVQPTDNIETWKNWSLDPMVISATRVDSLYGVSKTMSEAFHSAPELEVPSLLLYGAKDEVIPKKPVRQMIDSLKGNYHLAYYPEGWHWLPRDLNGPVVWKDILSWMEDRTAPLPSKADDNARQRLMAGKK